MKTCKGCKHADWKRNAAGNLHPSGDGRCTHKYKVPPLPASMHWIGSSDPKPFGGSITRRHDLNDHCVYWARA